MPIGRNKTSAFIIKRYMLESWDELVDIYRFLYTRPQSFRDIVIKLQSFIFLPIVSPIIFAINTFKHLQEIQISSKKSFLFAFFCALFVIPCILISMLISPVLPFTGKAATNVKKENTDDNLPVYLSLEFFEGGEEPLDLAHSSPGPIHIYDLLPPAQTPTELDYGQQEPLGIDRKEFPMVPHSISTHGLYKHAGYQQELPSAIKISAEKIKGFCREGKT
jgi:hypothetical protein